MARMYEVLFYNGWQDIPAYYLVDAIRGRSPKEALTKHLAHVLHSVREQFALPENVDDDYIAESLYVLRANALVSVPDAAP